MSRETRRSLFSNPRVKQGFPRAPRGVVVEMVGGGWFLKGSEEASTTGRGRQAGEHAWPAWPGTRNDAERGRPRDNCSGPAFSQPGPPCTCIPADGRSV